MYTLNDFRSVGPVLSASVEFCASFQPCDRSRSVYDSRYVRGKLSGGSRTRYVFPPGLGIFALREFNILHSCRQCSCDMFRAANLQFAFAIQLHSIALTEYRWSLQGVV